MGPNIVIQFMKKKELYYLPLNQSNLEVMVDQKSCKKIQKMKKLVLNASVISVGVFGCFMPT